MENEIIRDTPALTNRFRLNEANLRASAREQLRTVILLNYVFAAVMLGLAVYMAVLCFRAKPLDQRLLFRVLVSLGVAGFLVYQSKTVEKRSVRRVMQNIENQIGSRESDLVLRFGPDCFFTENSAVTGQTRRDYGDVIRVARSKDWIFLQLSGAGSFVLDPARFENGAEADFWKLMNEKCPRAVPKQYRS